MVTRLREHLRTHARDLCIATALLLLVLGVYAPVRHFDFISLDDPSYVSDNHDVLLGLTPDTVRWALTSTAVGNWHPLTWLSLMADCELFGTAAGPFHVTNLILHAASTLLLFVVLKRMTGASNPSAVVAFLFALHALHVESVVWVAERKDVLSGLFWMLTLWAYIRFVSRPRASNYLLALLLFLLGLAAKSMLVSLPMVLLLLDFWPLGRLGGPVEAGGRQILRLIREKFPFFVLAAAVSVITIVAQRQAGFVQALDAVPLSTRLGNASVSAAVYVEKVFWPAHLGAYYPFPASVPLWAVVSSCLVLAAMTLLALRLIPTRPYFAVGWFWYLITVLPVIGIVQVGGQARADRYTYIPAIGIFLIIGWAAADVWRQWPSARPALASVGLAACAACVTVTWMQIRYWQSSLTLLEHTIEVTRDNAVAHMALANAEREAGLYDDALRDYQKALEINPRAQIALLNLGGLLVELGRSRDALAPLTELVHLQPDGYLNHQSLGLALERLGRNDEAMNHFQTTVLLRPEYADGRLGLGRTLADLGRLDEAIAQFTEVLRQQPENIGAIQDLHVAEEKRARALAGTALRDAAKR